MKINLPKCQESQYIYKGGYQGDYDMKKVTQTP